MREHKRKCFMCGTSPNDDPAITLHRFPKPGSKNYLRCELWAKFCFPHGKWSSPDFQMKLYNEHRMLCHTHFDESSYVNFTTKKLRRHAAPGENYVKVVQPFSDVTNQAGRNNPQVVQPFSDVTNQAGRNNPQVATSPSHDPSEPVPGPSHLSPLSLPQRRKIEQAKQSVPTEHMIHIKSGHTQTEKEKRLQSKCRKLMKNICGLKKRVNTLKNCAVLKILEKDDSVNELIKTKIPSTFALLLQSQIKNYKRKSRGRRWTPEAKITALRLYKRSPTCYRLLRRLFCLPTPSTLKALLNKLSMGVGMNAQVFSVLGNYAKAMNLSENQFILMFDEMSIRKNLYYNKKFDIIEGFQDHGSQGRTPEVASHALVFMVAGIRKKVKQPIAYYISGSSVTADRLAALLKEVLRHCFECGLNITASVCDQDGVNRRALCLLGASVEHPHIFIDDNEVVTLFDTPHLLKCFRNLFLKYDIKCPTNISSSGRSGTGLAKWSHIVTFYEEDNNNPNFVFAPSLTKDHIQPNTRQKMRVYLAAQVLSHTVAAGLYAKISQGVLPAEAAVTANVISNIDKLFDCVNADTADLKKGKPHATNLKIKAPHLSHFKEMKEFFKKLQFVGCRSTPPTQEGWVWTIIGIERLWTTLTTKNANIKSLATRRLQQDPLENLFGCIRGNCGSNSNPTVGQFVAGLKTAILSNLSHISIGNCKLDENEAMLDNCKVLLSNDQMRHQTGETCTEEETEEDTRGAMQLDMDDDYLEQGTVDDAELQACAYVCGFILKHHKSQCLTCKEMLFAKKMDTTHLFVDFKEYNELKRSLMYASRDFILCVENCAQKVNDILKEKHHSPKIKSLIIDIITSEINFNFLNKCQEHKADTVKYIVNSVFHICIKRYCFVRNRKFVEEAAHSALKKKIAILKHV